MKLTEKKRVGNLGESLVSKYLSNRGFEFIEANYQRSWGEIDVITKKDGVIHFIEVKTVSRDFTNFPIGQNRIGDSYRPEDNVHPAKLKRLSRIIQTYIADKGVGDNWQFDVATVYMDEKNKKVKIEILENIVL
jgi:putative endonuclease